MTMDNLQMAVEILGVNKFYGGFHALKNITLTGTIHDRIVICGPSGSGKSTLIRCVNALEAVDSGKILVHGEVIDHRSRDIHILRRGIGMVFQQFNLFPHLTVLQNCTLAPVLTTALTKQEAKDVALHFLEKVHIAEQSDRYPSQLSGGQQQRAAIARALCLRPRVMLFDEPTSSLDPEMVKEVLDTMIQLAGEGMTMLCVTHEMGFAREIADRIVFMDRGAVVQDSSPEDFFSAQATPRAQQFLGRLLH